MTPEQLKKVLASHSKWLNRSGGERADLQDANLRYVNLRYVNLRYVNLRHANLRDADLQCADLQDADLRDADLRDADLRDADLRDADLRCANLRCADLQDADLRYVNLRHANLRDADLQCADLQDADLQGAKNIPDYVDSITRILPESGSFDGWKKCRNNVIVKLRIPAKAKRSNATGRKCRAEFVKVLEVFGADVGVSKHERLITYRKGEVVHCDKWDDDRWNECSGGIHFFITRYEAKSY